MCCDSSLQAKQERKCSLLTAQQATLLMPFSDAAGPQPVGARDKSIEMSARREASVQLAQA